jgi:hypothetical protein
MSIKIGDIEVAKEIIDLHYQVIRTQLILDFILNNNLITNRPDQARLRTIDDEALRLIQNKFPNMGIKKQ